MKTTYLINSYLPDGSTELVQTTSEHWHKIVEENKKLPKEKRRYFYADMITDSNPYDCIVMEVSYELFQKWSNEDRTARRNRAEKKKYIHVSWEALLESCTEYLVVPNSIEDAMLSSVTIDELRAALTAWQPWAVDILNLYLAGEGKKVVKHLAGKYKIGESTARRYKHDFKFFTKKFPLN